MNVGELVMGEAGLIDILKEMHQSAKYGEANAMLVLFGIKYAAELSGDVSIDKISEQATGRGSAYVRAGTKLAKYVEIK